MATPLQPAVTESFILPDKPLVQIETTSGGGTTTSTTSKSSSKQKSKKSLSKSTSRSSLDDGSSKGTVLLRQPMPKYSFQATKKKTESSGDLKTLGSRAKPEQQLNGSKSTSSLNNVDYTVSPVPVSMAMPQFIQSSASHLQATVAPNSFNGQTLPRQKPVSKVDPVQSTKSDSATDMTKTSSLYLPTNKSDLNLQTPAALNQTPGNVNDISLGKDQTVVPDNTANSLFPQPLGKALSTSVESLPFPELSAGVADSLTGSGSFVPGTELADQARQYKKDAERLNLEVNNLRKQLEVQFQVKICCKCAE